MIEILEALEDITMCSEDITAQEIAQNAIDYIRAQDAKIEVLESNADADKLLVGQVEKLNKEVAQQIAIKWEKEAEITQLKAIIIKHFKIEAQIEKQAAEVKEIQSIALEHASDQHRVIKHKNLEIARLQDEAREFIDALCGPGFNPSMNELICEIERVKNI